MRVRVRAGLRVRVRAGVRVRVRVRAGVRVTVRVRGSASRQAEAKHARRQLQWDDAKRAEVLRGDAEGWAHKAAHAQERSKAQAGSAHGGGRDGSCSEAHTAQQLESVALGPA